VFTIVKNRNEEKLTERIFEIPDMGAGGKNSSGG
jgi:hypothetical protein